MAHRAHNNTKISAIVEFSIIGPISIKYIEATNNIYTHIQERIDNLKFQTFQMTAIKSVQ